MRAELRIVGQVEATRADGGLVVLASPKAQAVAARLVVDRLASGTSRDELAAVVWPEGAPDTWGSALRSTLTRVRRFLDEAGLEGSDITSRNGRYVLRLPDDLDIDLELLERVAATPEAGAVEGTPEVSDADVDSALRVTTREFLPDNDGLWARAVRERIHELRSSCLEASSQHAERTRDPSRAVTLAREAVEHSPLRESAHRALMRAHAASGNRADALTAYHRCKAVLAEEVGVPPSRETTDLYLRLLGEAEPPTSGVAERRTPHRAPFVGRGAELELLGRAWADAQAGATRLVLVTGEPGIGRTRLLQEFVRRSATSEDLVVWCHGRGSDAGRPALQAALTFLADAVGAEGAVGDGVTVGPATRAAVRAASPSSDAASDEQGDPGVLAAVLREAFLEVARTQGPVLLLLDDLPDLDDVSLVALRDALVEGVPLPLAVVATADVPRLDETRRELLRGLEQVAMTTRKPLRRLGVVAAHDLAWQLFEGRSDDTMDAVLSGSGGNPYLLQLLARDEPAAHGVPAAVEEDVDRRLAGLTASSLSFLAAASVSGTRIEVDLVRGLAGLDEGRAHAAVLELLDHDLVVETGSPTTSSEDGSGDPAYGFAHGVVRDVLYDRLPPAERRRLHGELSEQIWTRRAPSMSLYSGWLVHHLAESGHGDAAAVDGYLLAAGQAEREGAVARAADLYAAALSLLPEDDPAPRARVATRLGLALWRCGDPAGVDHLTSAVYDAVVSAQLGLGLTAATALVDGWADTTTYGSSEGDAGAMVELMAEQLEALTPLEVESLGEILGRFLAHAVRYGAVVSPEHLRRGIASLDRLLETTTDPRHSPDRLRMAADLHVLAAAVADASALFTAADHALAAASVIGDPEPLEALTAQWDVAAVDHLDRRLVVRRHREREEALVAPADPGVAPPPPDGDDTDLWPRQRIVTTWLRQESLGETSEVAAQGSSGVAGVPELADRALEHVLAGRDTQAGHALALATRGDIRPVDTAALHTLGVLALVAAKVGTPEQARHVLHRLEPVTHLVAADGYRSYVGPVALHQGRLQARLGRWDEAERHLLSALTTASGRRGHELWVVVVERELAHVLERRGRAADVGAARDLRREADQLAAVIGRAEEDGDRTG